MGQIHQSVSVFFSIFLCKVGKAIQDQERAIVGRVNNLHKLEVGLFAEQDLVELVLIDAVV